jgi:hypothetical protein
VPPVQATSRALANVNRTLHTRARGPVSNRIDLCAWLQGMCEVDKEYVTFKHWKTGEIKTIELREADVPANPNSERLVVWNETEQKLEDVIKSTILEIREE